MLSYFQKQFVDDILGCGLLLYLSPAWLKEVYRHVIQRDFLSEAGYHDTVNDTQTALVQVLTGRCHCHRKKSIKHSESTLIVTEIESFIRYSII